MAKFSDMDRLLEGFAGKTVPGCACVAARNGKTLYEGYFGMADLETGRPITEDTVFRLFSMTKVMVCTAAMIQFERGKFLLNEPYSNYFPEYQNVQVSEIVSGLIFKTRTYEISGRVCQRIPQMFTQLSPVLLGDQAEREFNRPYARAMISVGANLQLSSPKRYYWDDTRGNVWWNLLLNEWDKAYNESPRDATALPTLQGEMLRFIPEDGSILDLNQEREPADAPQAYPERPSAEDPSKMVRVDAEDNMLATVRLPNGAYGNINASKIATGTEDEMSFEVYGSKGALRMVSMDLHKLYYYDCAAQAGPIGGFRGWTAIDCGQRYDKPAGFPTPKAPMGWLRGHMHCLYTFLESIYRGKPLGPTLEQGIYIQYLLEKVRESAAKRSWVRL